MALKRISLTPIARCVLCALPLFPRLAACSSDAANSLGRAGGGSAGSAAVGEGGRAPSGAGATQSAGGSTANPQAGVAGTTSAGGGPSFGGTGAEASGGASGGLSASASGGMGAGASGANAGGDGGSTSAAAELNGFSWTMACNKADTDPSAQDRCYLLPPGQTQCPSGGYTSIDKTLHFGGTPGTTYQVALRFQGSHEQGDYSGGTAVSQGKELLKSPTHLNGLHTWLSMEVSSPAATFNPNAGPSPGVVKIFDYTATITIDGGATIRMKAADSDCLMHRYCEGGTYNPCKNYVLEPISPASAPINGSELLITVESVKPM